MTGVERFGRTELPEAQHEALRKAVRIEWVTVVYYVVATSVLALVVGNSQAVKAALIEDLLAFLPPIAFLVAIHFVKRPPTERHPYGFHRAVAVAHLAAAVAVFVFGGYLLVESAVALLIGDHTTIGGVTFLGSTVWFGWLMLAVLVLTAIAPIFLGRVKLKLARQLHDKVLFADAQMNKADWLSAVSGIVGVLGIAVGWWWADAAAAIVISVDILYDGVRNLRAAVAGLIDTRARTFDDSREDPLGDRIDEYLRGLGWVSEAKSRVRDQGHVYHIESFVVPKNAGAVSLQQLRDAREGCIALDWKVQDLVVIPVEELPGEFLPDVVGPRGEE